MELEDVVRGTNDFAAWSHADKIRFFAWHLHTHAGMVHFGPSDIKACYDRLHMEPPSSIHSHLYALENRRPKDLLKTREGYRLEKRLRDEFDAKYGRRPATVQVERLLTELPSRIPNLAKRTYLDEALICFRYGAFRASIVMSWNLAFDHLCEYVLNKHLTEFNTQLPKTCPKARIKTIAKKDDFAELKEYEVLQVCASATIISQNVHKILKEKLDRRNIAAHPSNVVVSQNTAEEVIKDLVENVVLKLAW